MNFINELQTSEQGKSILAAAEKQFNSTDGVAEGAEGKNESLLEKAKEFANTEQGKKVIGQFEQQFGGEGGGEQSDLLKQAQGFLGGGSKTQ